MPQILTTLNGQTRLEYKECLYFKVNEGRYKLTDEAVMIYRPNGYDFFIQRETPGAYMEWRSWLFRVGEAINESEYIEYAATTLEKAKSITLK